MRLHRFINSLLYLVIQLVAKENKAKENNAWIRRFFVLFFRQALYIRSFTVKIYDFTKKTFLI